MALDTLGELVADSVAGTTTGVTSCPPGCETGAANTAATALLAHKVAGKICGKLANALFNKVAIATGLPGTTTVAAGATTGVSSDEFTGFVVALLVTGVLTVPGALSKVVLAIALTALACTTAEWVNCPTTALPATDSGLLVTFTGLTFGVIELLFA